MCESTRVQRVEKNNLTIRRTRFHLGYSVVLEDDEAIVLVRSAESLSEATLFQKATKKTGAIKRGSFARKCAFKTSTVVCRVELEMKKRESRGVPRAVSIN